MAARKATRYGLAALLLATASSAAELKPQTVAAWDEYVRTADAQMRERLQPGHAFLWLDESADRERQVRAGAIVVEPMTPHMPEHVPSGLVHHWIGAAFFPGARLDDVSCVLSDYSRYKEYYAPHVIDAKLIRKDPSADQFSLLVMNTAFLTKAALAGDYATSYFEVDARRRYSLLRATNLQEIEDYDQSNQHKLPAGHGAGYIWRIHSITRLEQRDGGVYIETEALALSRDIPASLHWLVDPVVRRLSRSSLITSLSQTRAAITAAQVPIVSRGPAAPHSPVAMPRQ
jgi:hypothetical protein